MENKKKLQDFFLSDKEGIFFYTGLKDKKNRKSYLFINPVKKIICSNPESIQKSFKKIENYLKKGFFAAGFVSYETGYLFEKKLKNLIKENNFPFIYFLIFKKSYIFNNIDLDKIKNNSGYVIYNINPNINFKKYYKNFQKIKNLIKNGETYQINYCFKLKFKFFGDLFNFFKDLNKNQTVSYAAFLKTKEFNILSISPELFFRIEKNNILLKPMKGTLLKTKIKSNHIKKLQNEKNKAENVMIVDLIRNDLGKICEINSIKVSSLFKIEEYETLYQMTSEIHGKLKTKNFFEIFKALFPSGSVTGAPKIRAMQVIKDIEKEQRKIYTGTIGFITPEKNAVFNIPIRTILLNNRGKGEIGIGSGIVYDSNPESEFKECLGKAKFLTLLSKPFALIETMRIIKDKGYFLLNLHLKRLKKSCKYFNINCDFNLIKKNLLKIKFNNDYKIRLLIFPDGSFKIEKYLYKENPYKYIAFSKYIINSKNIFLYHKTTNRDLYNNEYQKAKQNGFFDFIFLNEKGEITEGCISNIFIKKGSIFYTPPVKCGLLPGVYREYLLKKNPNKFKEKILYKKDIINADEIYLCNSVAGLKRVFLKNL